MTTRPHPDAERIAEQLVELERLAHALAAIGARSSMPYNPADDEAFADAAAALSTAARDLADDAAYLDRLARPSTTTLPVR